MSLSRSVSTALLIADIVCARADEQFKARLLVRVWLLFKFSFTFNHLIWVTIVFTDERGATLKQYDKHYLGRYRKDII